MAVENHPGPGPRVTSHAQPGSAADAIRRQLELILASPAFNASDRSRGFLRFVVEETLAGRGERIKAYAIAVDVFGRDPSFDAQNDPLVRLEAGRLRRALEHYYLTAGGNDPIVISIPRGRYQPTLEARIPPAEAAAPRIPGAIVARSRPWPRLAILVGIGCLLLGLLTALLLKDRSGFDPGTLDPLAQMPAPFRPSVLVVPFVDRSTTGGDERLALGLSDQIVVGLTRFREIVVFGRNWPGRASPAGDLLQQARALRASHVLEGSVISLPEQVRVIVRLHATTDGATVWSASYDRDLRAADLFAVQDQIAADVVQRVALPAGALAGARPDPAAYPDELEAYRCALDFYAYRRTFARDEQPKVVECLVRTVARHPNYATGWARLALAWVDTDRFYFPAPVAGPTPLDSAVAAARRAIALDPEDVRAWQALMVASYLRSDVAGGRAAGERALQLNPNDLELVGEFGMRLAMAGDWERGTTMMRFAMERDAGNAGVPLSVLAVDAMRRGRFLEAIDYLGRADGNGAPTLEMVRSAALGHLGRVDEARAAGERGLAAMPGIFSRLDAEFDKRNFEPEIRRLLLDGWRKAGLPVPDRLRDEPGMSAAKS